MVSPAGPDSVPMLPMMTGDVSLAPPGGTGAGAPRGPGANRDVGLRPGGLRAGWRRCGSRLRRFADDPGADAAAGRFPPPRQTSSRRSPPAPWIRGGGTVADPAGVLTAAGAAGALATEPGDSAAGVAPWALGASPPLPRPCPCPPCGFRRHRPSRLRAANTTTTRLVMLLRTTFPLRPGSRPGTATIRPQLKYDEGLLVKGGFRGEGVSCSGS